MSRLARDFGHELTQGTHIVEHVETPAMRRDDEIGCARMDL